MEQSTNLGLNLITDSAEDKAMLFSVWRAKVAGNGNDSNMKIIDEAMGEVNKHFPATGRFVSANGQANADYAVSEGSITRANGQSSHAEGNSTRANGQCSHAEGSATFANGYASHGEGISCSISEDAMCGHAEGLGCKTEGRYAHSEGHNTQAMGENSHTDGLGSYAAYRSQHVFGEYNTEDSKSDATASDRGNYVEIVGNGADKNSRSNARTLDWNGNEELAGDLTIKKGASGEKKISDIVNDVASLKTHFPSTGKFVTHSSNTAGSNYATAEGSGTQALASYSHAEGQNTTCKQGTAMAAHAEGSGTNANGSYSHAEGLDTTAVGVAAHADGKNSTTGEQCAHAEGTSTTASGVASHAEGSHSTASGGSSHAEGYYATASGSNSHAEGTNTVANHKSQHVFGEYNIADASDAAGTARGNYAEVVGNGTSDAARSNARVLDWSGNEKLAGGLTLGMGTADEVTVTAAQLKALLALLS